MEKEGITLPFLRHCAVWKDYALNLLEWIQGITEETGEKKSIKISGDWVMEFKCQARSSKQAKQFTLPESWAIWSIQSQTVHNSVLVRQKNQTKQKIPNNFNGSSSPDCRLSARAERTVQLHQDTFQEAARWPPRTCQDGYCRGHGWQGRRGQPLPGAPGQAELKLYWLTDYIKETEDKKKKYSWDLRQTLQERC